MRLEHPSRGPAASSCRRLAGFGLASDCDCYCASHGGGGAQNGATRALKIAGEKSNNNEIIIVISPSPFH
jgi:hypothetical protein